MACWADVLGSWVGKKMAVGSWFTKLLNTFFSYSGNRCGGEGLWLLYLLLYSNQLQLRPSLVDVLQSSPLATPVPRIRAAKP